MKPETEYIARQLAGLVLSDRGDKGCLDGAAVGLVRVELEGMTRSIRQAILVDHVSLAGRIADEIEAKTKGINLDEHVRARVAEEVDRMKYGLDMLIRDAVCRAIESRVESAVQAAMRTTFTADVILEALRGPR